MMKLMGFVTLVLLLVGNYSCTNNSIENGDRGYHVKIGDKVENIKFNLIDGSTIYLNDSKGKVVVLQFTASWCSVCRKEMPFLEKEVWQKFKDDDFILIGVDLDEPLDKVKKFVEKMNTTYPMSLDLGGEIFSKFAYEGSGVTRNVVIGRDGRIAYLTRLFDREEFNTMKEKISDLIYE
jgi:peroxiredoxin